MILGNFITEDPRGNNAIFGEIQPIPMGYYELMREAFLAKGIEINTPDLNKGKNVSFDLVIEGQPYDQDDRPRYLIAVENPHHNKLNADHAYCSRFSRVFTWNPELDSIGNVVRVFSPHQISKRAFLSFGERDIFCSVINANKSFRENIPSDLYPERMGVIRWYEKNAPELFALYGRGWDRPPPAYGLLGKMRRSIPSMRYKLFGYNCFPSYKGEVAEKKEILQRSKFSYCYENNRDITNYITEKIIDSFVNGCVPIYWGADNVLEYIPENCFIDRRKFKYTKDVHEFLLSISPEQFSEYQSNIGDFLKSENAQKFSFENFVSTVVSAISVDIGIAVV
jgi:hypothetical protein